jgi:hypothetical protein
MGTWPGYYDRCNRPFVLSPMDRFLLLFGPGMTSPGHVERGPNTLTNGEDTD